MDTNTNSLPTVGSATEFSNSNSMIEKKDNRKFYQTIFKIFFVIALVFIAFWAGWIAQQELSEMEDEILNTTPEATQNTTNGDSTAEDQLPGSTDNVDDTLDADYLEPVLTSLKSDFEWVENVEEGLTALNVSFYECSETIENLVAVNELNTSLYSLTLSNLETFDAALANVESYLGTNGYVLCDDFSSATMSEEIYYMDGRYIYLSHGLDEMGVQEMFVQITY